MPDRPPPRVRGGGPTPDDDLSVVLRLAEPRVHLLASSVLIDAGALEAGWQTLSRVEGWRKDPRLRVELGDELLRLARRWDDPEHRAEALTALRLAADVAPRLATAELARELQRGGSPDEALRVWAEAIRLDPNDADHHLHRARLLEARARPQEAYAAYLHLVDVVPTVSTVLTVAPRLARLARRLPPAPGLGIRIAMIGSANLDQLRDCLAVQAHRAGLRPEIQLTDMDRYSAADHEEGERLRRFSPDVVIMAIHRSRLFAELAGLPDAAPAHRRRQAMGAGLDRVRDLLHDVRRHSSARVLLHNMVVPEHPMGVLAAERELGPRDVYRQVNLQLGRIVSTEFEGMRLLDEDGVQSRCGKAEATDPRHWLAAGLRWSATVLRPLAGEQLRHILADRVQARTCLVLGLDNTLWGGRLADRGADGIALGTRPPENAFLHFQRKVDRLRRQGVRVALSSTADPGDALAVLVSDPRMLVRAEHCAAVRLGRPSVPQGIREVGGDLGIGLDRMVFWDGDAHERARVRTELPEVLTPEVPADPALRGRALLELAVFDHVESVTG